MKETRFKDTEIGRIPEDWTLIPIRELAKDMADGPFGSNLKTEHYTTDKQVRIIQLGNIGDCGWLDDNTKYTTFEHAKTLSRCIATPSSILVAKMMPAGRSIVCPSEEIQYILGSDVVRIVPNEKLIAEYFVYQSKSEIYLSQIAANTQGSTRQRTSISKLKDIYIPFPPIKSEQTRIATALSNIDALISELGKLIEKKRAIKQGAMQQLLTGKKRLKGFSEPWVERQLGEICDILNGDRGDNYPQDSELQNQGVPFVNAGHLKNGRVDFADMDYISEGKYNSMSGVKLEKDDILICLRGSLGKNAKINFSVGTVASSLCVLRSHKVNVDYLVNVLNSYIFDAFIKEENNGSSQPNLSASSLKTFSLTYPHTLSEQSAIASVLTSMDNEISALEAKKAKYEQIKQGMMQQLLTGRIRLVETAVKTNATSANVQ